MTAPGGPFRPSGRATERPSHSKSVVGVPVPAPQHTLGTAPQLPRPPIRRDALIRAMPAVLHFYHKTLTMPREIYTSRSYLSVSLALARSPLLEGAGRPRPSPPASEPGKARERGRDATGISASHWQSGFPYCHSRVNGNVDSHFKCNTWWITISAGVAYPRHFRGVWLYA